jgi:anion-transporting  ArsA/GET3 family ATPase
VSSRASSQLEASQAAPFGPRLGALLHERRIIVCCGAGGVGKTTTSASLGLAAARMGRRVLVLTIDPSRRLAETLGVVRNPPEPVSLSSERLAAAGIRPPGSLEAWMLDPKLVSDQAVRRLTSSPSEAEQILENRIYKHVTEMVASMQEYTAMEALRRLIASGRYDLVVLDTPPSRNALDFLEAPGRLAKLMDGRFFSLLLPKEGGLVHRTAARVVERVLRVVFGQELASELAASLAIFAGLLGALSFDASEMRAILSGKDVSFLLVTSPSAAALAEASFFHQKTRELSLPFSGFVLNRIEVGDRGEFPTETLLGPGATPDAHSGLRKLQRMARAEQRAAEQHEAVIADLKRRAGPHAFVVPVPNLSVGADDLATLLTLADVLTRA